MSSRPERLRGRGAIGPRPPILREMSEASTIRSAGSYPLMQIIRRGRRDRLPASRGAAAQSPGAALVAVPTEPRELSGCNDLRPGLGESAAIELQRFSTGAPKPCGPGGADLHHLNAKTQNPTTDGVRRRGASSRAGMGLRSEGRLKQLRAIAHRRLPDAVNHDQHL